MKLEDVLRTLRQGTLKVYDILYIDISSKF
jgi:hypothetical protein